MQTTSPSQHKQIRSLILLLSASVLFAFLTVFSLIYIYGPDGSYKARNILLSPGLLTKMDRIDVQRGKAQAIHYIFNRLECVCKNEKNQRLEKRTINWQDYDKIYRLVEGERSIKETIELRERFNKQEKVSLFVYVIPKNGKEGQERILQEFQFLAIGDFFRVELIDQHRHEGTEWIYFHTPQVGEKIMRILNKGTE